MNEHELEDRLHHERIILPEGFDGRQEAVLFRAMEQKRRPVQRAFVLAVALALLICATALAADGLGLAFFWQSASPEAEALVEKRIPQSGGQLDDATFTVREAVFDGNTLQAVVAVQAAEGKRAVMQGYHGNVSADGVLVDCGEEGSISNFGASLESYLEAGFNYSFPLLNDRLYIGVRGKFLAGLARAQVNYDQFDISLQQDRWAVVTKGTIDVTADGTSVTPDPETGIFQFSDIDYKPRKPAGYGFAVDLGATYDILPNLQASLAVTDLGFISWDKNSTVSGVSTQQTEFTGVTVPDDGSESTPDFAQERLKRLSALSKDSLSFTRISDISFPPPVL